jgi:hypothetical protein
LLHAAIWLFATSGACVAAAEPQAPAATCDRNCVAKLLDSYMRAMVAHNPDTVKWSPSARTTQNAALVKPGDGVWQTASNIDDYRVVAVESAAGQGVVISSMEENGIPELQMTRLKVDAAGRINEAESLFARNGEGQKVQAPPAEDIRSDFQESVPVASRLPRARLVSIVDKYFDAIEQSNGAVVAFAADMEPLFAPVAKMTCAQGLSSGIFSYIKSIAPRRYPVVDVEHGLVLALIRFNHPGNILGPEVRDPGGKVLGKANMMKNEWASHPTSALIAELFKVKNEQITRVFAVIVRAPYRASTGWDE